MIERHEYVVLIGGQPHTLLLTDEDAARYGDLATKAVAPPANKARTTVANKGK